MPGVSPGLWRGAGREVNAGRWDHDTSDRAVFIDISLQSLSILLLVLLLVFSVHSCRFKNNNVAASLNIFFPDGESVSSNVSRRHP